MEKLRGNSLLFYIQNTSTIMSIKLTELKKSDEQTNINIYIYMYQNVIVTDEYFYETRCLTSNLLLFILC